MCADLWRRALQVLASERFSKIVDVLRQKTKSSQLVRSFSTGASLRRTSARSG